MGYVGQKLGHQAKSLEILVNTLEAILTTQFWWNLVRIFLLQYLGQVRLWVMLGQKIGHQVKS